MDLPKDVREAQLLPPELWVHVFHRVPWHSRERITLVCQTFRWLAQPLLFERVTIKLARENLKIGLSDRLQFISSPRISSAVKVCRISTPTALDVFTAVFASGIESREIGLDILSQFKNLVSLRLDGFNVTPPLLHKLASLQHLSEMEFVQCAAAMDVISHWLNFSALRYLKFGGIPMKDDMVASTVAGILHPMHTRALVLGFRPLRFLQRLVDAGSTLSLTSLTVPTLITISHEFSAFIDICPALEELRFNVERVTPENTPGTYRFNKPSTNALPRLRILQAPWYMVESFTAERPVAHLIIWDFDEAEEGAIEMLASQSLQYPVESLGLFLPSLSRLVVGALASMTSIRALSLVVESQENSEVQKVCHANPFFFIEHL